MLSNGEVQINFKEIVEKSYLEMGNVNIIIAGKTGVGKSTLINAIFGEDLATVGVGRPVSQSIQAYTSENVSGLTLFDTKGLELENEEKTKKSETILQDLKSFISSRRTVNPSEHIHICWYCILGNCNRYEQAEITFIKELQSEGIPVIVVFTQTTKFSLYKQFCNDNFSEIPNVVKVLAVDEFNDVTGTSTKAYGLDDLVKKTVALIPESAKNVFIRAQKVDKELKRKSVNKIIAVAASAAVAAGATPIPFADAFVLAPIQIGMLAKISVMMGLNINSGFLSTLVGSAAGVLSATAAGRTLVSWLLKMFPGAGSVAGGAISAAIAGTFTTTMGWAYYKAIDAIFTKGIKPENVNPEDLADIFKDNLRKGDKD
jgi:uncharacterized protein (DUF697 family)/GTP-binding protein EngB required for normal cell division